MTISTLKDFVSIGSLNLLDNPFTNMKRSNISGISEKRFDAFLLFLSEQLVSVKNSELEIESVINEIMTFHKKAEEGILKIMDNERARVTFATIGKTRKESEETMTIVSMSGFLYSLKDKGWIFE